MGQGGYLVHETGGSESHDSPGDEESGEDVYYVASEQQTEGNRPGSSSLQGGSGRDMTESMTTTVPQSMLQHDLNLRHKPSSWWRRRQRPAASMDTGDNHCCRLDIIMVVLQFTGGVIITAMAFYMHLFSAGEFKVRECPHWAGIPLLLAGVFGIYQCSCDAVTYAGSTKAYVIKCLCSILSTASVFLCLTAALFTGYHTYTILTYTTCHMALPPQPPHCSCTKDASDPLAQVFIYYISSCELVDTEMILFLSVQCGSNLIAGILSFILVVWMWSSRYSNYYSGLKFYSYAADVPPHPWFDPNKPPYQTGSSMSSLRQPNVTVRQASTGKPWGDLHKPE